MKNTKTELCIRQHIIFYDDKIIDSICLRINLSSILTNKDKRLIIIGHRDDSILVSLFFFGIKIRVENFQSNGKYESRSIVLNIWDKYTKIFFG